MVESRDRARWLWGSALGAAGAALLLLAILANRDSSATIGTRVGDARAPVVISPATLAPETLKLDAVGTSRALRSVSIHPAAAGEVVAIHFEANQRVEQGQLLVELDARDEKLARDLADVRIRDAQRLVDRYSRTAGTDAVPPTEVDAAETALAEAIIERDRAQVALDDRFIRATFDGHVGLTDIDVGDRIDPSTAITTLDDRSALLVNFELPEALLGRIRTGQPVTTRSWNPGSDSIDGEIVDIGSRIDPLTRTVVARARVPNEDDLLRPGMSFRVHLRAEGESYPRIPEVALQWGATGSYVWTLEAGQAVQLAAEIVQRQEGYVLVDGPIDAGMPIVVEGIQSLRPGRELEVVEERP